MAPRARTELRHPLSLPVIHILLALADGARHGYAIKQEVEERSNGEVRLGPGTLYGAITRLEDQGWIRPVQSEDRRKPYCLTASGKRHLEEQLGTKP
jgi:DNA-binding PadR family transcriptional regulator